MSEITLERIQRLRRVCDMWDEEGCHAVITTGTLRVLLSAAEQYQPPSDVQHALNRAVRQFRHNSDNSPSLTTPEQGFVAAYDKEEIDRLVACLIQRQVLPEDVECAVSAIRKSDCGAWLKECGGMFTCSEGSEKRRELSRLLDNLYRVCRAHTPELPEIDGGE